MLVSELQFMTRIVLEKHPYLLPVLLLLSVGLAIWLVLRQKIYKS